MIRMSLRRCANACPVTRMAGCTSMRFCSATRMKTTAADCKTTFHLGPPDEWSEDQNKILIREMWSSPIVFRRAGRSHTLCSDAKAWNKEARRRVKHYRDCKGAADGERILVLGEDEDGKTDDLHDILVKIDETFNRINGQEDESLVSRLLAPLPINDNEEKLSKNKSSTVLNLSLSGGGERISAAS